MNKPLNHFYGVVYFPKLNYAPLNEFRKKYDPTFDLIEDHVTIVFLIPDTFNLQELKDQIGNVVKKWRSFDIHISGLSKSWDHWLFLTIKEGNQKVIELHDQLYKGPLKPYLREDIEYKPHIGLGYFGEKNYDHKDPRALALNEENYRKARSEAESLNLDFWRTLDHLCLLKLNKDFESYRTEKIFYLKN